MSNGGCRLICPAGSTRSASTPETRPRLRAVLRGAAARVRERRCGLPRTHELVLRVRQRTLGGLAGSRVRAGLHRRSGRYDYMAANRLLSMYDFHSDGSGVCYSSRLRPNLTMRPSHYMRLNGIPHLFSGDLHLVDWLEHEGYRHDVLTDEALHFDGSALLEGYRVVITGTHPRVLVRADARCPRRVPSGRRAADVPRRKRLLLGNGLRPGTPPRHRDPAASRDD